MIRMNEQQLREAYTTQVMALNNLRHAGKLSEHQHYQFVVQVEEWTHHYFVFGAPPPEITVH